MGEERRRVASMLVVVAGLLAASGARAAVPLVLPGGEAAADWERVAAMAGLDPVGAAAAAGARVIVVADGARWRVEVRDARGAVRVVHVAPPRTDAEREDLVWVIQSLLYGAVGTAADAGGPAAGKRAAEAAPAGTAGTGTGTARAAGAKAGAPAAGAKGAGASADRTGSTTSRTQASAGAGTKAGPAASGTQAAAGAGTTAGPAAAGARAATSPVGSGVEAASVARADANTTTVTTFSTDGRVVAATATAATDRAATDRAATAAAATDRAATDRAATDRAATDAAATKRAATETAAAETAAPETAATDRAAAAAPAPDSPAPNGPAPDAPPASDTPAPPDEPAAPASDTPEPPADPARPPLVDLDTPEPPPPPEPLRVHVSVSGGVRAGGGLAARPALGACVGLDGRALGVALELVGSPEAALLVMDGDRAVSGIALRAFGSWRPLRTPLVTPVAALGAGLSARAFLDTGDTVTWGLVPELHARAGVAFAPTAWLTLEPTAGVVVDARPTRVGTDPDALDPLPLAAAELALAVRFSQRRRNVDGR